MSNSFLQRNAVKVMALAALSLTACVDNDYDLAKDIDMTVEVGGDLTFPTSNTANYTVAQIMDLGENSSIVPYGSSYGLKSGDYVLVQDGTATKTSVKIPLQTVNYTNCAATDANIPAINSNYAFPISNIVNEIHLEDNSIDKSVRSLSYAYTDITFNFTLKVTAPNVSSGTITIKSGTSIAFPAGWTVEPTSSAAQVFCKADGNRILFTADKQTALNGTLSIPIKITGIKLSGLATGQGLYEPGKFRLDTKIVTQGSAVFKSTAIPTGQTEMLNFLVSPSISNAKILKVDGTVSPDVTIKPSTFSISGIPDWLSGTKNNLDLSNPQIQLVINNTSPVEYTINASITAYDNKNQPHKIYIGQDHGTDAIVVHGNTTSSICLSRTGAGYMTGNKVQQVAVPQLAEIIETVPKKIVLDDVTVKASDKEYTFELGSNYDFDIKYKVVAPLAFGRDLKLSYSSWDKGWGTDLDKYNFKQAIVTVEVESTVPLDMIPTVQAIDAQTKVLENIKTEVIGYVKAGSLGQKIKSRLSINLTSTGKNIGNLDGVLFSFTASCPEKYVGVALNKDQEVRFTNIRVRLIDGVTVDLN